jgi:hypothetical protein
MSLSKKLLVGVASAAIVIVIIVVGTIRAKRSFFYPNPPKLPPVVAQSTDELLSRLQSVLQDKAPEVARRLQPGISDQQIGALETKGNFRLPEDLKAFYRWHNGMSTNDWRDFVPGNFFWPLEDVLAERAALAAQLKTNTPAQRRAYQIFAGHRNTWLTILPDGAGDGYFYDPERNSFFYHFAENGSYHWFPSFRNFLAGVIECYETGAFFTTNAANRVQLEEDYERSGKIWNRLGANNHSDE